MLAIMFNENQIRTIAVALGTSMCKISGLKEVTGLQLMLHYFNIKERD